MSNVKPYQTSKATCEPLKMRELTQYQLQQIARSPILMQGNNATELSLKACFSLSPQRPGVDSDFGYVVRDKENKCQKKLCTFSSHVCPSVHI